jgi:hypothetical protein
MRSHSKQQTDGERFAGNNSARIGEKLGFNEFFSLVYLRRTLRRQSEE